MNNQNSKQNSDKEETKAGEKIFRDMLSGEAIKWTPEEEVRQLFIKKLIKEYKYPKGHIKKEVPIKSGQTETKKKADIVVFHTDKNFRPEENAYIIIECKKKDRKDGVDQLETYLSNTTAEYGVWFNGKDAPAYIEKTHKPHRYLSAPDIPFYGKTLADIGLYKKGDLVAAEDLKTVFEACHNYIYANEGYLKDKVFNEVVKLIFVKMIDEKSTSTDCEFRITTKELREVEDAKGTEFRKRIEELFKRVVSAYPDIFGGEKILLKTHTLAYVVSQLQKYDFTKKTRAEIKGVAFQTFVHSHLRGERGEFFTPYPILKMAIEMLAPKEHELILDPACGSGGFLVTALNFIRECFRQNRPDLNELDIIDAIRTYGNNFVYGIDFNPDLARVSKMYMVLNDDGHTGIFSENSLEDFPVISEASYRKILPEKFNIIVTNPPFGARGKITRREILDNFDLGHKWVRDKGTNEWIDPEYYQPIFNEVEKVFKKQKTVNLGDISLEIKYGTSEDLFYVEKGVPFLRVTDINKFSTIEPMEGKFISNFDAERLKEYQVKKDDIIISRTGTLGLAVYIDEKLDGAIYGSYFIKVKPRHKGLNNRFIAFFISSKIGGLQTNRWASGGIQTNLTIDAIRSIRIPILSQPIQQKISSLIQESVRRCEETKNLIKEAKQKVENMILIGS